MKFLKIVWVNKAKFTYVKNLRKIQIMKEKKYSYVGPEELLSLVKTVPKGFEVISAKQIFQWLNNDNQELDGNLQVIATYVIDQNKHLHLADRRSEHVACAGGEPVLCAGEITFFVDKNDIEVVEITNLSTGYCPEPDAWCMVSEVLTALDIKHPEDFTTSFIFRRCVQCGTTNVVKECWYYCAICDAELDKSWNLIK